MTNRNVRAIIDASAELGHFGAALHLFSVAHSNDKNLIPKFMKAFGSELPLFEAIAQLGLPPSALLRHLNQTVNELDSLLEGVKTVVVAAIESDLLDQIAATYPDKKILAVIHQPGCDRIRIESNFDGDFETIQVSEFADYADPLRSVLLIPGFQLESTMFTTYPSACRILGEDTKNMFADIVAIDLMGTQLQYYCHQFAAVSNAHFSEIIHLPMIGNSARQYDEVDDQEPTTVMK